MQDATLAQLVKDAAFGDEATLRALADRLADASMEDRLEAVRAWAKLAADLASSREMLGRTRETLGGNLMHGTGSQSLQAAFLIDSDARRGSMDLPRYADQRLAHQSQDALWRSMQDDRWYAIRRRAIESRMLPARRGYLRDDMDEQRRLRIDIVPLDGGAVLPLPSDGRADA
jgi:hypothetical protein